MDLIEEVIRKINDQTDALYEGMCDKNTQEVIDSIVELRKILKKIEDEY